MQFAEHIAEETKRQFKDSRFQSLERHQNGVGGRVFFVLKASATNYTQFVEDHPDYKSGDGVVTTAAVYNTVDDANNALTAAQGDTVYIMPGHTETITSTSTTLDISGATFICLGNGLNRPTFTYSTAAATINVGAANVSFLNGHHIGNFLDVAAAFTLGAAKDFRLEKNTFVDNSASLGFLSIVVTGATDNDADGLSVVGNYWQSLDVSPNAFISILAAEKRVYIADNDVFMDATNDVGHFLTIAAKVMTGIRIMRNTLTVVGATNASVGIFVTGSSTTNTGIVAYNLVSSLDTTSELIMTAALNFMQFENYYTGNATATGKLWPVVDAA